MKSVDEFVIFDQAQYIRRGWINRNRILNSHKETVYITVPVCKTSRETKIKDIKINNVINWEEKLFNQLLYYKNAPNYIKVIQLLEDCFLYTDDSLSLFNTNLLKKTTSLLGIETNITILSEKFPNITSADTADEWGIKVSKALNGTTYINAIGGRKFYDVKKYGKNGINIKFLKPNLLPYQQFKDFIPGLSIIDLLMFNDVSIISEMLNNYELLS